MTEAEYQRAMDHVFQHLSKAMERRRAVALSVVGQAPRPEELYGIGIGELNGRVQDLAESLGLLARGGAEFSMRGAFAGWSTLRRLRWEFKAWSDVRQHRIDSGEDLGGIDAMLAKIRAELKTEEARCRR